MAPLPTVLVLGGVGFIGRNFVAHLVENGLAAEIRVIDKVILQTAYLNKRFQAAFEQVEFQQGDLSNTSKWKWKCGGTCVVFYCLGVCLCAQGRNF